MPTFHSQTMFIIKKHNPETVKRGGSIWVNVLASIAKFSRHRSGLEKSHSSSYFMGKTLDVYTSMAFNSEKCRRRESLDKPKFGDCTTCVDGPFGGSCPLNGGYWLCWTNWVNRIGSSWRMYVNLSHVFHYFSSVDCCDNKSRSVSKKYCRKATYCQNIHSTCGCTWDCSSVGNAFWWTCFTCNDGSIA